MSKRLHQSVKPAAKVKPSLTDSAIAIPHFNLTNTEKTFLLHAEKGDCASVSKILEQFKNRRDEFNINCLDPLNRSALIIALEKENIDLINLLLDHGIEVNDALLHAINEEYVEGVEVLLQWEEANHVSNEPYSWEKADKAASSFNPELTPVILAAHKNNYEILKLLLDRGAAIPTVHDIRCGCDKCVTGMAEDSLRHSQSRISSYRAMISPSLICLSSKDPLITAFELYDELKKLERIETEFRSEYNEMRKSISVFANALLDQLRTTNELEIVLNYDSNPNEDEIWEPGDHQSLARLNLAIKYKLKAFVAHPNVQQLLGSMWYQGIPEFRRKTLFPQILYVSKTACMFMMICFAYWINPNSETGKYLKIPFIKFVVHSASFATFLGLLALASQRVENLVLQLSGIPFLQNMAEELRRKERGKVFGVVETLIIIYVISLVWKEMKSLYKDGIVEYLSDLWNILDYCANLSYTTWISLRLTAYYVTRRELAEGYDPWYPRDKWDVLDPHLVSDCAFSSSMILSFMRLVNIFSVNPHLGPLQISLGRMIIDIIKFFFIYTLVLFSFGCGMNQLLWYFAGLEEEKCYHKDPYVPDFATEDKACTIWRRFANLFETSQSLFWASFGMVDLGVFDLTSIKSLTRFWALLIFGCYSVINIIVLLNMLIAMMSNSYQIISERADEEWKFARSKLFIMYFESGDTLPPPFNLIPSIKNLMKLYGSRKGLRPGNSIKKREMARERADLRYNTIMQFLMRRYVTVEQKKLEEFAVTEDDISEVRHDISTLRFELIDIFKRNKFDVPKVNADEVMGKKDRLLERRIKNDFQIRVVEGVMKNIMSGQDKATNIFSKIAQAVGRKDSKKKDWNKIVQKHLINHDPIGKQDEALRKSRQQSIKRYLSEYQKGEITVLDPEKLVSCNPSLGMLHPTARMAYCKFKLNLIKQHHEIIDEIDIGIRRSIDETASRRSSRRKSSDTEIKVAGPSESQNVTDLAQTVVQRRQSSAARDSLPTIIEIPTDSDKKSTKRKSSGALPSKEIATTSSDDSKKHIEVPIEPKSSKSSSTTPKKPSGNWI